MSSLCCMTQRWRAHLCQEGSQAAGQPGLRLQVLVRHRTTALGAEACPAADPPHTARTCATSTRSIPRQHTDHASASVMLLLTVPGLSPG